MNDEYLESEDFGSGEFDPGSVYGSDSNDMMVEYIYHDLSPEEKIIFEHSTGYSGKPILSNPELRDKLDMTQGQLSYRKRKLREKIKEQMDELEKYSEDRSRV